jgi:hypothetical protein
MADADPDLNLRPGEDEAARSTDDGPPPGEVGTGDPVEQATSDREGSAS